MAEGGGDFFDRGDVHDDDYENEIQMDPLDDVYEHIHDTSTSRPTAESSFIEKEDEHDEAVRRLLEKYPQAKEKQLMVRLNALSKRLEVALIRKNAKYYDLDDPDVKLGKKIKELLGPRAEIEQELLSDKFPSLLQEIEQVENERAQERIELVERRSSSDSDRTVHDEQIKQHDKITDEIRQKEVEVLFNAEQILQDKINELGEIQSRLESTVENQQNQIESLEHQLLQEKETYRENVERMTRALNEERSRSEEVNYERIQQLENRLHQEQEKHRENVARLTNILERERAEQGRIVLDPELAASHRDEVNSLHNEHRREQRKLQDELNQANRRRHEAEGQIRKDTQNVLTRITAEMNNIRTEMDRLVERRDMIADARERVEERMTLREKIKAIFKKYGFTVIAVVTAVGVVIGTIIHSLSKGLNKVGGGVGNALKGLGKKIGEILPGMVGAIASFIFRTAGQVISFLGKNAWLLIMAVVLFFIEQLKNKRS